MRGTVSDEAFDHCKCSGRGGTAHPFGGRGRTWTGALFLSQAVLLADGATQTWVTLTRKGNFTDPRYGKFAITTDMLGQVVANFDKRVLGPDVFVDVSHKPSDGAAGKVLKLSVEGGRLRALVEWTPFGVDAIEQRGFTYLSAEYHEAWKDKERQQPHGGVLLGAGLTVRPVIKHLEPVQLSNADDLDDHSAGLLMHIGDFDAASGNNVDSEMCR